MTTDEPYDPPKSAESYRRVDEAPTSEEKTLGLWAHLGMPIASFVVGLGIVVPIILLLVKGSESEFVSRQCKEAINFAISMYLYLVISGLLCLVIIGFIPLIFFGIFSFVMPIVAGLKAQEGVEYRYPLTVRLV